MTFQIDTLTTLFLTVLCLLMGVHLKKRIEWLQRFCIPSPVIGGFLVSLLIWGLKSFDLAEITFDTSLQTFLMVAFFTTVGIDGSFRILKSGGRLLITYLLICWTLVIFQDTFGAGLAHLLGIDPVIGIMAGGVSLTGGHGGAAAFGSMAEGLGVQSATVAAIAAATFGLISGSLLGGPIASYLIKKHKVTIQSEENIESVKVEEKLAGKIDSIDAHAFLKMLALILGVMVIGQFASAQFTKATGFSLPSYVGAMIIAIIVRNINDQVEIVRINQKSINLISDVSLGLFLTMAMMSLKIWELKVIALPLFIILLAQTVAIILFIVFVVFRLLGKNYDAAVMCSGMMGHGLGATPNAMANMSSVCERYKHVSMKAFMIVPLSGAVLIDLVGIPYHTWLINMLS
ncbi:MULTISPECIES: sodium/glutamate symporter [Providencia]|uniref:Sodium/glutamate symporter n=2 Tax=Providencia rustigianii TaxID=158850 RepID=D1P3B8_9GAMM|nr:MULTISPECIES: sodium/glutamate symporter [Providencia]EFB72034.1 sodium/glutamate symporter [Providencia rustigianii DSM 4541]MTC55194.1 sodium/glutamate symporter [Providencia rustigianii]MTC61166.1 sodium/glutamate symporter [Providencia rustigianii]SPY78141.1 Glutamate permease [Providencia rustigianii]SUC36166.1 Glutamate permease [Providencia rustigianii]